MSCFQRPLLPLDPVLGGASLVPQVQGALLVVRLGRFGYGFFQQQTARNEDRYIWKNPNFLRHYRPCITRYHYTSLYITISHYIALGLIR